MKTARTTTIISDFRFFTWYRMIFLSYYSVFLVCKREWPKKHEVLTVLSARVIGLLVSSFKILSTVRTSQENYRRNSTGNGVGKCRRTCVYEVVGLCNTVIAAKTTATNPNGINVFPYRFHSACITQKVRRP